MFVIDRSRGGTDSDLEETVEIAGTTGNVYSVNIARVPSCTCPHAKKGNQCKHIIYVRDLKVEMQALLTSVLAGTHPRAQGPATLAVPNSFHLV